MEGGDENEGEYKRRRKRDWGVREKEKKKRETRKHPRIKLVIGLVSNIKEQTSSDFAENDFFNTTLFLFILLSSESFPVFV